MTTETPSRARSNTIGALASLLLALPFILYGLFLADTKARVELQCAMGGPCTVTRSGWLTKAEPEVYTLEELNGTKVERNRKSRASEEFVWRPVLVTARGDVPLSYGWMKEQKKALYAATVMERYLAKPLQGFTLWHDDRAGPGRLGAAFTAVGVLLLGFGGGLLVRARRFRRAERSAAAS